MTFVFETLVKILRSLTARTLCVALLLSGMVLPAADPAHRLRGEDFSHAAKIPGALGQNHLGWRDVLLQRHRSISEAGDDAARW